MKSTEKTINNKQTKLLIEMLEDRIFMLEDISKIDNIDYANDIIELQSLKSLFELALKS